MNQPALFAPPAWTDRWNIGDRCRNRLNPAAIGTVIDVTPGRTIRVEWTGHPYWGTFTTTYGLDHLIEPFSEAPTSDASAGASVPAGAPVSGRSPTSPPAGDAARQLGCAVPVPATDGPSENQGSNE